MNDSTVQWETTLPDDLRVCLEEIRRCEVPESSMKGSLARASSIGDDPIGVDDRLTVPRRVAKFNRAIAALAGILVLTCSLASVVFFSKPAWAQVVDAVKEQPWMRLTLQRPEKELPQGESFPETTIWLSGDGKIAARSQRGRVTWWDRASGEQWEYVSSNEMIHVTSVAKSDAHELTTLITLLERPRDVNGVKKGAEAITNEVQQDVESGDEKWREFRFDLRVANERTDRVEVRVNPATNRPFEMRHRKIVAGTPSDYELIYSISFPQTGPADIHAMDVPRNVVVSDLRDFRRFFRADSRQGPADYDAIVFRTIAGRPLMEAYDAVRYRSNAGGMTEEVFDFQSLMDLNKSVAIGALAPGRKPDTQWWSEQIDRLKATQRTPGVQQIPPHDRCYLIRSSASGKPVVYNYGGPTQFATMHEGRLNAIETLELRGEKLSVWLDKNRDMIVRRIEVIGDDGQIHATHFNEVDRDDNGVWFPTSWIEGVVARRGASLDLAFHRDGRINSSLWIAHRTR